MSPLFGFTWGHDSDGDDIGCISCEILGQLWQCARLDEGGVEWYATNGRVREGTASVHGMSGRTQSYPKFRLEMGTRLTTLGRVLCPCGQKKTHANELGHHFLFALNILGVIACPPTPLILCPTTLIFFQYRVCLIQFRHYWDRCPSGSPKTASPFKF